MSEMVTVNPKSESCRRWAGGLETAAAGSLGDWRATEEEFGESACSRGTRRAPDTLVQGNSASRGCGPLSPDANGLPASLISI